MREDLRELQNQLARDPKLDRYMRNMMNNFGDEGQIFDCGPGQVDEVPETADDCQTVKWTEDSGGYT